MSLKIAILASGRGSNARAIISSILDCHLDAEVQCLISNIPDAPVLDMARQFDIQTYAIPHKQLSREEHESKIIDVLRDYEIDYIVLAGYMRLITPLFLKHFKKRELYRIINIHPSLLPAFPGAHGYEDAYNYGVKVSGITIHFLDEKMDNGPIILQESFPRLDGDTLEDFKRRGLELEHVVYPKALQLLAKNKVYLQYNASFERYYVEVKANVPC